MALDPAIADQVSTLVLVGAQRLADNSGLILQNLTQGLGVVQTSVIQMNASNSDDPALFAALQTATRTPSGTPAP